jgi:hypothetical protein
MNNQRLLKDGELALIYTPGEGLRIELPTDEMPIGIDGAVLATVFVRLSQGGDWADELKHRTMAAVPGMPIQ